MPTQSLTLISGVDIKRTPTFAEAAINDCNLIRFMTDREGKAEVQKLGGWSRYYPSALPSIARALWGWQDTNNNTHLAAGGETSDVVGVGAPLTVISNGIARTITPQFSREDVAPDVTTDTSTNVVQITDVGSNISSYTSVFVATHISVGGVLVFGFYQCSAIGADSYHVSLYDILGTPVYPTSSVIDGGSVAEFSTTINSASVNVLLNDHNFAAGSTFPILISTTVGGVTLVGNYIVQDVVDANNFTIFAPNEADSSSSVFINGGDARYYYYVGQGPLPEGSGYGAGGYGSGGYGTGSAPSSPSGANIEATDWMLDNWGQDLLACPQGTNASPDPTSPSGGAIYVWSPLGNLPNARPISTGPVANNGIFVAMPQRQIIAWGSTFNGVQDALLVRWSDINDYSSQTAWIASPTNQAGSYRIPRGSRIVSGLQVGLQGLIWTDLGVWTMQYINLPYVYSFNELATGCGLIAPKAAAALNGSTYWMAQSQFFVLDGSGVRSLPCPVWDYIFQQLDTDNVDKIRVAANSRFNEIAWYFPKAGGDGEVSNYVKLNVLLGPEIGWDFGVLDRTAWINQSVLGPPIGGDSNSLLQQHETSNDADGQAINAFFQTGYFEISDGNFQAFLDWFLPDFHFGMYGAAQNATILLTFLVAQYSGDTPLSVGPHTITQATQFVSTRLRGRLAAIRIESNDVGTWWRMGRPRYRFSQDGRF